MREEFVNLLQKEGEESRIFGYQLLVFVSGLPILMICTLNMYSRSEYFGEYFFYIWLPILLFLVFFSFLLGNPRKEIKDQKSLRERLGAIQYFHPTIFSLFLYLYMFNWALIISNLIFYLARPSSLNAAPIANITVLDNFFLTLLQIQVTVFSIIVSLTIIALQLMTEKYSQRIVEYFKEYFDFYAISFIYIIAITLDLIIINLQMQNADYSILYVSIYYSAMIFGLFSILSLFPYIWNMLVIIRPENLIKYISSKIDDKEKKEHSNLENAYTILEIMHSAVRKKDFTTTSVGITWLLNSKIKQIDIRDDTNRFITILSLIEVELVFREDLIKDFIELKEKLLSWSDYTKSIILLEKIKKSRESKDNIFN
jgi:hypothetical protein